MEHKDRGFVGKHYLMKQAFGQEGASSERGSVYQRGSPRVFRGVSSSSGCADYLRLWGERRFWKSRRGSFAEVTPFLHLLAKSCPGMCREACALSRVGEGIQMKALEKACALYGGKERGQPLSDPAEE